MTEKLFSENYVNYQQTPRSKQIPQMDTQAFFSYSGVPLNNTLPSTTSIMDLYNIPQNINRNQNVNCLPVNIYQEPTDFLGWESRLLPDIDKTIKSSDKIDMIEINSKDLSPSSYCSNIDLLVLSDCYKTPSKDMNYQTKYDSQWCNQSNCNQKNLDYPSCAQEKSMIYCDAPKNPDLDSFIKKYTMSSDILAEGNDAFYKCGNRTILNDVPLEYNAYNYYDSRFIENQGTVPNDNYFNTTQLPYEPVINSIDQQTEGSNEESDIIVEESDEDVTDYSEDQDKRFYSKTNKCLICNMAYTPLGTQFYLLTTENPLTMSSQKPVCNKIIGIVGELPTVQNYLCSACLGLINTIDHLQLKLENFTVELRSKFEKTCAANGVTYGKKNYKRRIRKRINNLPKYKCKVCQRVLCLKKYCCYHLRQHKNYGYLCELCGKICSTKKKFYVHSKRHKQKLCIKIDSYKCSNCDKIFRTKSNLTEHENYCLGILPFQCKNQHCDKKFASATKLKNHIKLKHDKKFMAICSICNIGFIKLSDYKSHMISHSTDKKYSCTKCDKSYKTLSNLNFHMKMHAKTLPFSCELCNKGFMRKEYLEAHVNNHKGLKNFGCTICDKKFVSQKNLDSHLKYHEGTAKKNNCNICGKTFSTGFEEHLRVHNNLREFECEQCDMRFNTKGSLSKHVKKKHLDVKPISAIT